MTNSAMPIAIDLYIEGAAEVFTSDACGPIADGVVAVAGGQVAYVGPVGEMPAALRLSPATRRIDARGGLVTPGLVDAHTHIVFAGDRAAEFARRAAGQSYLEIADAGGGIAATMRATRAADEETLVELARPRLDRMLRHGVTTVEVKSGYGLETTTELKMLRTVAALDRVHPIELVGTFLGAHTIPPEHRSNRAIYIDTVVNEMIPAVAEAGLARFCDVFVEESAFGLAEAERVLRAGLDAGLSPKVHADQLTSGGGAELAASVGAVSADHLEHVAPSGIAALARAGTTAVLLPGCALFLDQADRPPARTLIDAGVPVALATDCNPGTCHTENLELILTLGVAWLKLSPREALEAVTVEAARAIGLADRAGVIATGRPADFAIFDVPSHTHLPYHFGDRQVRTVVKAGRVVFDD